MGQEMGQEMGQSMGQEMAPGMDPGMPPDMGMIPGAAEGGQATQMGYTTFPFTMPDGSTVWMVNDPEMGLQKFYDEASAIRYAQRLAELGARQPAQPTAQPAQPAQPPAAPAPPAPSRVPPIPQPQQSAARAAITPGPGDTSVPASVSAVDANAARDMAEQPKPQPVQQQAPTAPTVAPAAPSAAVPAAGANLGNQPPAQYNPNGGLARRGYGSNMAPASAQPVYGGPPVPGQPQPVHRSPDAMQAMSQGVQQSQQPDPSQPLTGMGTVAGITPDPNAALGPLAPPPGVWDTWASNLNPSQRKVWEYGHNRSDDLTGVNPLELGAWSMPMPGAAEGTGPMHSLPPGPTVVGENGPEILNLPPGASITPLDGSPGGPVPMYHVQPANHAAQQALGGPTTMPMTGAAEGGVSSHGVMPPTGQPQTGMTGQSGMYGAVGNQNLMRTAQQPMSALPSPTAANSMPRMQPTNMNSSWAGMTGAQANQWQQKQQEWKQITGKWMGQESTPAVPYIMSMGSDANQPTAQANAAAQAAQAAQQQTPASPQSEGQMWGYSAEQLSGMPWLQALSQGIRLPYYQNYSGPLSLGDMPGAGDAFRGIPKLPAPHQISMQTWNRLDPSTEQQMSLGAYRALGFNPETVQRTMMMAAPSSASIAPPRWQKG